MPIWEIDDRGAVIPGSVKVDIREIWAKKWHSRNSGKIPPVFRDAVRKAIDDYERLAFQAELAERRGRFQRRSPAEIRALVEGADRLTRSGAESRPLPLTVANRLGEPQ